MPNASWASFEGSRRKTPEEIVRSYESYAAVDGAAVALHEAPMPTLTDEGHIFAPGWRVCFQTHPPNCAVGGGDRAILHSPDHAMARAIFRAAEEMLRDGDLPAVMANDAWRLSDLDRTHE